MELLTILKMISLCVINIWAEKFGDCFSLMSLDHHLVEWKQPPIFLQCVSLSSKCVQVNTDVVFYILSGEDGLWKIILEVVMGIHKKYHF